MNYLVAVDFSFLDFPGGAARVSWDIALAARDEGWSVSLLCLNPNPRKYIDGVYEDDGIKIVRYTKPTIADWNPARMFRQIDAATIGFRKWIGAENWDLVHMHSPFTGMGVMNAARDSTRYVYTVHSPIVREQQINWATQGLVGKVKLLFGLTMLKNLEKVILLRSSAVHALSEFTRNEVQYYHRMGDRVTVIPHWARDEFRRKLTKEEARRKLGWPANSTIFFTVRQHRVRYGIDIAIRALARLKSDHRWMFYIGGDGPLRQNLERLAVESGVGERVNFMGILSDETLSLAYQAADAFILPTLSLECFGLIVLEALAFGCPVIGTDAGAIPEILQPIAPDFIVPAGNVEALQNKIVSFLNGQLKFVSQSCLQKHIDSKFHQKAITKRLIELLSLAIT